MTKRITAALLALFVLLAAFAGCSNPDGKKLLEDAAKKQEKVKTMKIGMNFDLDFDMSANDVPTTLSNNMVGDITMAFGESKSYISMDFSMPSIMNIAINEESYFDNETKYIYLKNMQGWRKAKVDDGNNPFGEVFSAMSMSPGGGDMMSSQSLASLFMLSKEINTKGKKDFNDVSCYEIEILLNPDVLKSIMSLALAGAGAGTSGLGGDDDELIASITENMNMHAYVGTKDGLLHGMDMQLGGLLNDILAQSIGAEGGEVNMKKSDFNISMVSDYKDDAIKIPDEALNATEMEDANTLMQDSMILQQFATGGTNLYEDDSDLLDEDGSSVNSLNGNASGPSFNNMRMVDELTSSKIGNEVDAYSSTAKAFYVVAEVSEINEPITVFIDWYIADSTEDQLIDSVSFDMDADNIIHSTLNLELDKWPAGEYYVEFSAAAKGGDKEDALELGSSVNTVFFSVE